MSNRVEMALYSTAARTFEDLAFMFPEPGTDSTGDGPIGAGVCVAFRGPVCGRLELRVSEALLPAIASSMLGEDDDLPRSQQIDALGEIANVVCGNVLPVITDATKVFHLDGPRVLRDEELPNVEQGSAAAFVHMHLDQGSADLHLYLNGDLN
jgi:CheY-specific phosphatase CheX